MVEETLVGEAPEILEDFILNQIQKQEKGLIEGLPLLKYSSRIEDQMPDKFY
jgi:hypothetical protein